MKNKRFALSWIAASVLGIVFACAHSAEADSPWGVQFRIGRSAVQVGHGHFRYGTPVRRGYHGGVAHRGRRAFDRGHYDWHDTSHYDYVPGGYRRHGRHYDYLPGQWRLHQDGHYDFHRGGHHGRRQYRH